MDITFDNLQLATKLCNNDHDIVVHVNKLTYIHFYNTQGKQTYFNNHFFNVDNVTYYADYFVSPEILKIILNNCSDDIINYKHLIKNEYSVAWSDPACVASGCIASGSDVSINKYVNKTFDKAIIFYIMTLSVGHEFASIMYIIYLYKLNKWEDYDIVVSDQILKLGSFLQSVLFLFFKREKIHFVDNLTHVTINDSYIYYPPSRKNSKSIDFLLDHLTIYKNVQYGRCNKNICMIKTDKTKMAVNSPNRAFSSEYDTFFLNKGFDIIVAEDLSVFDLYVVLNNCENIILSWGCNSWINSVFVNKLSNVMILCHELYSNEYSNHNKHHVFCNNVGTDWTPVCNKLCMVYDLPRKLDESTQRKLDISFVDFMIPNLVGGLSM
jgi:hypothetical protein